MLTADHASLSDHPFFANPVGYLTIPILIFKPDGSMAGEYNKAFSQTDILPSTLNLLGYNKPFFAFGESYASGKPGSTYSYISGQHFLYGDSIACSFVSAKINSLYNYKRDSVLNVNLVKQTPRVDSLYSERFKAFIQTYNATLLHNTGHLK